MYLKKPPLAGWFFVAYFVNIPIYMNKIMKTLLYFLVVTPLIVDSSVFSPYVTGKSFFVWSIVSLISVLFIINFFSDNNFKNRIIEKVRLIYNNSLVVAVVSFILIVSIGTIFAVNKYNAFWGTLERSEGLTSIICFFSIFVFTLLVFEKKDWLWFFRLSLFVTLIILIKEFIQFFEGVERPGPFLGNPTFLAGYLLFSIFCSLFVFNESNYKFWKFFSLLILPLSILGIVVTQTRGTLVGAVVGFMAVLVYGIFKGKDVNIKKVSLRNISIIVITIILAFSTIFISTRKNELWQRVPVLGRLANISSQDSTTQTRLLNINLSINSINPSQNGIKKLIIGWGQDNFSLAYHKYFNPIQFSYESNIFDRAHNKILDVLVMNGILGLLAYLSIFLTVFYLILKKKEFSWINAILIFWIISYLIHLLFVFDQITTWIPLFVILSYFIYINNDNVSVIKKERKFSASKKYSNMTGLFFVMLSSFIVYVYISNVLIGYIQMYNYKFVLEKKDNKIILDNIDSSFVPFTLAQSSIRANFMEFISKNYKIGNPDIDKLVYIAAEKEEDYLRRVSYDYKSRASLAVFYTNVGKKSKNIELMKKGENHFKLLFEVSPNRFDYNYSFALNLFFQKRYEESFVYFEKSLDLNKNLFLQKKEDKIENIYLYFFKYFYQAGDRDSFVKVMERLNENEYKGPTPIGPILEYIKKNNTLPKINFE